MKKITFITIASILLFTGCQGPMTNSQTETTANIINNQLQTQPIAETLEIKPSQQTVDSQETALNQNDWKTYTSQKYGFKLKYPSDFEVHEDLLLKGTGSEHYAISFSKGFEYGFLSISPESSSESRPVMQPKSSEQILGGKKALVDEWDNVINIRLLDDIQGWKLCDDNATFCTHITAMSPGTSESDIKSNMEIYNKMVSSIEFFPPSRSN